MSTTLRFHLTCPRRTTQQLSKTAGGGSSRESSAIGENKITGVHRLVEAMVPVPAMVKSPRVCVARAAPCA